MLFSYVTVEIKRLSAFLQPSKVWKMAVLPLQVIEVICQLIHRLAKWSLQPSRQWFLLSAGNRVLSSQYLDRTIVDARCYPPINFLHVVSRIQHILIGHKAGDTLQCPVVEKCCPPDRCNWPVECHSHTSSCSFKIVQQNLAWINGNWH